MFIKVTLCKPQIVKKDISNFSEKHLFGKFTIVEEFKLNPDKYAVLINTDKVNFIYQEQFDYKTDGEIKSAMVTTISFKDTKLYVKESFEYMQKMLGAK